MEEINRKLLKMEEMVLRSGFFQPTGLSPWGLLIPSGSPAPWPEGCRAGGSSDALFAHSMKPPVIAVRSGNFIYSCVAGTSVCFSSQPAFVCCPVRSRLTPLPTAECRPHSVAQALLWQEGPGRDLVLCPHQRAAFPGHPLLSVLATLQFVPYSRESRLPATSPNPPQSLAEHTSPGLRPSARPFLLPPVIHCSFWGSSSYLV